MVPPSITTRPWSYRVGTWRNRPADARRAPAANRFSQRAVCSGMNRRLPLPPGLGRFVSEYGLAVGIAIGAVIGLIFGNVAIGVVGGIPLGLGLAS